MAVCESATELDYAWAAGLLDGEGCIHIERELCYGRPRYYLVVAVQMTHRGTLNHLHDVFGGASPRVSRQSSKHRRAMWRWQLSGPSAAPFLCGILPFSQTKQQEISLALEALTNWGEVRNGCRLPDEQLAVRDAYYLALRQAKVA